MNRRVSPSLAGRLTELALLTEAFQDAGQGSARTALVSGEAGVGKTRLIQEFVDRLPSGATVLTGACLDHSDASLPYSPFRSILRDVVHARGATSIGALIGEPSRDELARLLPALGPVVVADDDGLAKARMFEAFRSLIEAICSDGPCVLIVEDAHWADRGTQDLLSYLVSSLTDAPLLLVVSFRAEEPQTTNQLRRILTELSRLVHVIRVDLAGLTQAGVAQQLDGILGESATPEVSAAVHRLSEGVPLFTEALIAPDGSVRSGLPDSFRGLLLRMVEDLPAGTQQLLKAAAVGGPAVEHEVLVRVTGLETPELTATIGPAVAAKVMLGSVDGYAFRHGLIRDAILTDLLPGESIDLHRQYAEALTATVLTDARAWTSAAIARHWLAARQPDRALAAAWSACSSDDPQIGDDEKLQMLEMVLTLWDQADAHSGTAGASRLDVLELAAGAACWACESERGLTLVDEAFKESPPPERSAVLLLERAIMRRQSMVPGEVDDLRDGIRLAGESSLMKAELVGQLARALIVRGRHAEARQYGDELAELTERLPCIETRIESRLIAAWLQVHDGADPQAAFADLLAEAEATGVGDYRMLVSISLLRELAGRGRHLDAIDRGRAALDLAVEMGRTRYAGPLIANLLVGSLIALGHWDQADETIDSARLMRPPVVERQKLLVSAGLIAVARGDFATMARILPDIEEPPGDDADDGSYRLGRLRLLIELAAAEGRVDDLTELVASLPPLLLNADATNVWPVITAAALAVENLGNAAELQKNLRAAAADLRQSGPLERAYADTVSASMPEASVECWFTAAQSWQQLGQPYHRARALLGTATALLAADHRPRAKPVLVEAAQLARDLSARPLTDRITAVARRARISLGTDDNSMPRAPFGLTERECEVLRLLVEGLSNREIAASLVISPKTVGVHISNILRKLDVPTRAAAASAAHRHHLL
ncbi:AAA family ATPase [Kribbella sp. NPDC056861]|uniref:AAA family ATPase n=1 Tax=Kribbella sp. NPDC056861 TaxID=3154857 RepID=UPI00342C35D9